MSYILQQINIEFDYKSRIYESWALKLFINWNSFLKFFFNFV